MADKIVVLNGGRIEQIGAPLDLYDRPANVFVAGFIGSPAMNLVRGRVEGGEVAALGARLPLPPGARPAEGQAVVWGVRPEHLALADGGPIAATVAVVEPTGLETHVALRAAGADLVGLFRERHAFRPGQALRLAADPQALHLFDAASGARMG